jgi:hypothetical protein
MASSHLMRLVVCCLGAVPLAVPVWGPPQQTHPAGLPPLQAKLLGPVASWNGGSQHRTLS